jgi:hypothetical protein
MRRETSAYDVVGENREFGEGIEAMNVGDVNGDGLNETAG